jgi:uncharacterized membrane protein YbhN (UPF0104 family)
LLLLHRVTQLGSLLLLALVCGLIDPTRVARLLQGVTFGLGSVVWVGWALLAAAVLALVALASPLGGRVRGGMRRLRARLSSALAGVDGRMASWLAIWTLAFHVARLLGFQQLCAYFGQSITLADLVFVLTLAALAGLLPVTVGGLGVMEGAIVAGLSLFSVPAAAALGVALLNRSVLVANALVGAVVYLVDRGRMGTAPPRASREEATS